MTDRRDAYVEKLKAQLDEWNARIDLLEATARRTKAEARLEYQKRVEPIRGKWTEIRERLAELQSAAGQSWEVVRDGIEAAWSELREGFEEARSILGERRDGDADVSSAQLPSETEAGPDRDGTAA